MGRLAQTPFYGVCDVPKGHIRRLPFPSRYSRAFALQPQADLSSHLQRG